MKLLAIIVCLICASASASAQPMESIEFAKARVSSGRYELNRFGIEKIKIRDKAPSPATDDGISGGEKFLLGALTLFTGVGTGSSSELLVRLDNRVKLTGVNKKIGFQVLVNGYYEKDRERVRDEDGSSSIETFENYTLYWDRGADGTIVVEGTTLGDFSFTPGSMAPDSMAYWKGLIQQTMPAIPVEVNEVHGYYQYHGDFVLNIIFENKPYLIVYEDDYHRCTLIHHGQIIGVWQNVSGNRMNTLDQRIHPFLLLPQGSTSEEAQRTITLLTLGLTLDRNQSD